MKHTMAEFIFLLMMISSTIIVATAQSELRRSPASVCIIGSGIGGSSVAHFLRKYSGGGEITIGEIRMFEQNSVVGGRMATVSMGGDTFEAGASILHPKNYHAVAYVKHLNLTVKKPSSDDSSISFGIWNGHQFVFKTLSSSSWKLPIIQRFISFTNSVLIFFRYGFSLFRMNTFVEETVNKFLKYYQGVDSRPVFESVEEMLKWSGLYNLTMQTLEAELKDAGLSSLLIQELVTVITRINYGQSVSMSGLAGAVSLAGSGGGLWAVEGGNWQMAAELIKTSEITLHLQQEIESVSYLGQFYELNSTNGESYPCEITVIATPLDELNISFIPKIYIPERKLQHTHATFIRGLLNPTYFGLDSVANIPELVGTVETPDVPFSSISVLKKHGENDMTYKVFSRQSLVDDLLDNIFSSRTETIRINWAAYPHYHAPEKFASFILDDKHLYYINAFENAASTMETSAVAAENIARLILSRLSGERPLSSSANSRISSHNSHEMHLDL